MSTQRREDRSLQRPKSVARACAARLAACIRQGRRKPSNSTEQVNAVRLTESSQRPPPVKRRMFPARPATSSLQYGSSATSSPFGVSFAQARRPRGRQLRTGRTSWLSAHPISCRLSRVSIQPCRMYRQPYAAGRKGTMAKEICISSTPHETRLAILEDDQLAEIYYERENEYTLAGSIYNGRVTRVLPGMQSAFVDLGLERDAFLYVTDFIELEDQEDTDELEKAAATGQAPREVKHPRAPAGCANDRNGGRQRRTRWTRSGRRKPESEPERARAGRGASDGAAAPQQSTECGAASGSRRRNATRQADAAGADGGAAAAAARTGRSTGSCWRNRAQRCESTAEPAESHAMERRQPPCARKLLLSAQPAPHAASGSGTIVLPGESLSKYGGAPAGETTPRDGCSRRVQVTLQSLPR